MPGCRPLGALGVFQRWHDDRLSVSQHVRPRGRSRAENRTAPLACRLGGRGVAGLSRMVGRAGSRGADAGPRGATENPAESSTASIGPRRARAGLGAATVRDGRGFGDLGAQVADLSLGALYGTRYLTFLGTVWLRGAVCKEAAGISFQLTGLTRGHVRTDRRTLGVGRKTVVEVGFRVPSLDWRFLDAGPRVTTFSVRTADGGTETAGQGQQLSDVIILRIPAVGCRLAARGLKPAPDLRRGSLLRCLPGLGGLLHLRRDPL